MFVMGSTNIVLALRGHRAVRISQMSARDRVNHAGSRGSARKSRRLKAVGGGMISPLA